MWFSCNPLRIQRHKPKARSLKVRGSRAKYLEASSPPNRPYASHPSSKQGFMHSIIGIVTNPHEIPRTNFNFNLQNANSYLGPSQSGPLTRFLCFCRKYLAPLGCEVEALTGELEADVETHPRPGRATVEVMDARMDSQQYRPGPDVPRHICLVYVHICICIP